MVARKGEKPMRLAVSLMVLTFTTGAAAESVQAPQAVPPEPVPGAFVAHTDGKAVCRDRIHEVRQERGLPKLQRDTASPDEALLIAAVDKRIDGCSVMVMLNDLSDVRPLPAPPEGPLLRRVMRQ
jgi:hypothetical protein